MLLPDANSEVWEIVPEAKKQNRLKGLLPNLIRGWRGSHPFEIHTELCHQEGQGPTLRGDQARALLPHLLSPGLRHAPDLEHLLLPIHPAHSDVSSELPFNPRGTPSPHPWQTRPVPLLLLGTIWPSRYRAVRPVAWSLPRPGCRP